MGAFDVIKSKCRWMIGKEGLNIEFSKLRCIHIQDSSEIMHGLAELSDEFALITTGRVMVCFQ